MKSCRVRGLEGVNPFQPSYSTAFHPFFTFLSSFSLLTPQLFTFSAFFHLFNLFFQYIQRISEMTSAYIIHTVYSQEIQFFQLLLLLLSLLLLVVVLLLLLLMLLSLIYNMCLAKVLYFVLYFGCVYFFLYCWHSANSKGRILLYRETCFHCAYDNKHFEC